MAKGIAIGLLIASLALLIIYGADAAVASSSPDQHGFLPLNESVRGGAFGGGAVVMSIIAFVIGRKDYAPIVSILLFVNGALIIIGILVFAAGSVVSVASTGAMGAVLIGLGIWKAISDKKIVAAKGKEPAQK
jgi:hypothetical protein